MRIQKGSKGSNRESDELPELSSLDSAFQLDEYLDAVLLSPAARKDPANKIVKPPPEVNRDSWLYELLRKICIELNYLVVALLETCQCTQMKALDWEYLCAAHVPPNACDALSYITHTLDQSSLQLTNPQIFPSRISVSGEGVKYFPSMIRRLYRIFAHAYFQHEEVFWKNEEERSSFAFFMAVVKEYELLSEKDLIIPSISQRDGRSTEEQKQTDIGFDGDVTLTLDSQSNEHSTKGI